jgi:CRISPR type IV-associated protein Csf3
VSEPRSRTGWSDAVRSGAWASLRVTLRLGAPVATSGDPIHLDSLLAWVRLHVVPSGLDHPHPATSVAWEPDECISLPLARLRWEGHWWYRASAVTLDGMRSRVAWSKRWDREHEDRLDLGAARQLTLKLGRYKEYHVPMELIAVPALIWYAVGNYRLVRALVRRIPHVGRKASQGYGLVTGFSCERLADDPATFTRDWRTDEGRPARNVPAGFARERGLHLEGTRRAPVTPPYWRVLEPHVCEVAL